MTGQPHSRNLDRWDSLVERGDVLGLHRALTGLDRDSIEMREVSPMSGLVLVGPEPDPSAGHYPGDRPAPVQLG